MKGIATCLVSACLVLTCLVLTCLLSGAPALAGWASGGGKIHRDSLNPWFLENVATVFYCIDIDESNFGVSRAVARRVIRDALDGWKEAFARSDEDYYEDGELEPYGQIRIATQTFQEIDCDAGLDPDLRFQLGTLTDEQRQVFDDPRDYVGLAYRTAYDLEQLRGKGFIYLAPSRGPLRPDYEDMDEGAWSVFANTIFRIVVEHEIGHIFGVSHRPESLMDEMIPELTVSKTMIGMFLRNPTLLSRFQRDMHIDMIFDKDLEGVWQGCGSTNPIDDGEVFGVDRSDDSCGKVEIDALSLRVWSADDIRQPLQLVAEARHLGGGYGTTSLISLYVSAEQRVFSRLPNEVSTSFGRLFGESVVEWRTVESDLQILTTGQKMPIRLETRIGDHDVKDLIVKDGRFYGGALYLY